MIFIFFHGIDPNSMTSLTPRKSEHYVVVMRIWKFKNVVLSELYTDCACNAQREVKEIFMNFLEAHLCIINMHRLLR